MVTASMTGKTPLFRRTVERKAAGDRGVAPASMRSIVIDPGAAGLRGWYRIKIASPDNRLRWVQVEAIDKTGVPFLAFTGSVTGGDFSSWLYVGASIFSVRLSAILSEPNDAALSATLRPISPIEFVWHSVFPKTSWRPRLPENESGFLRRPSTFLRSYLRPPGQFIAAFSFPRPSLAVAAEEEPEPESPELPMLLQEGLCIVGYLCSEIGLGQAARNLAYACDSQRLPLSFCNLPLAGRQNDREFATKCNQIRDRKANVLITGLASVGTHPQQRTAGRLNVLYPFWELARVRPEWLTDIRRFDEIWAPTAFVASALADTGRPVRLVRQPLRLPAAVPPPRSRRETLRLFTYLDFDSYGERKNPAGAVNAFQAAFKPAQRDVELVVKVRGASSGGLRRWLRKAAAADPRIKVIDRTLDRAQMDALMADCDAFISLHRSEGFGFGAAEALAAGKAVVATNYGGTTDFISPATGYPVDYTLVPVKPGEYVDTDGQVWAAPRLEAAAAALQAIYQDPADAYARTVRGFTLLHEQSAPAVIGAQIERLLRDAGAL